MLKKKENKISNQTSFIQLRGIEAKKEIENFINGDKNKEINDIIINFFTKLYFSKTISRDKTDREIYNKNNAKNTIVLQNGISLAKLNESTTKYICFWDRHPFDWSPVKIPFCKLGRHPLNIIPNSKKLEEFICTYEFCSYECQCAYILSLMQNKANNPIIENAYYYMLKQFRESYPDEKLNPANDPILIIGNSSQGAISIDEFRKNIKKYVSLNTIYRHNCYPVFQVSEY